jgi:hypothetical protein
MWIRVAAGAVLAVLLFRMFRLAMRMRFTKLERDRERAAQESQGRRVVAELPLADGIVLFLEDRLGFSWGGSRVECSEIAGARLLLNGGIVAEATREGEALPSPSSPAGFDGSERWEVELLVAGAIRRVPCGRLREGVSRAAAAQVFEAVKAALAARGRNQT